MFRIRHFMDSIREYYSESDSWSNRSEFIVSDIDENYTEHRKISNSLCLGDFILSPMKKVSIQTTITPMLKNRNVKTYFILKAVLF
uniref:Uncharacterized protein n=1 Tax=Heterorhabditis bacteriophora TaxID=37862 RepID=A0A1I7XF33_HETBA